MGIVQLIFISAGLAMDAFAVSICKGLKMRKPDYKYAVTIALLFGVFQAGMPLLGWVLGKQFSNYITSFDHWIAFALLAVIGGKMLFEAFKKDEETDEIIPDKYDIKELFVLAIATSIDALAVGITFAFLGVNIVLAISLIGIITFCLSFFGVMVGNKFGLKFKSKAEIAGGVILILIGTKILIEHLCK